MTETVGYPLSRPAEFFGWCCAGLLALSVHVGAASMFMRDPPLDMPADDMPPAAIMIEMAPEAEAVETELTEITPDQIDADAAQPVEEVDTVVEERFEEPVEEVAQAEPVAEEVPEEITEVEEPVEEMLAALPDAEVPLPVARPKPLEEKKPEERKPVRKVAEKKTEKPVEKPVRPRQRPQAASQSAVKAQAQVRKSDRNAGRQTASGLFPSVSPARWQSRLMAHLERRKRYPSAAKSRGERGTVYVRFSIDDAGNVLSASLSQSSGYPDLDNEVLALVRRASPVPTPPPGVNRTITTPVKFSGR